MIYSGSSLVYHIAAILAGSVLGYVCFLLLMPLTVLEIWLLRKLLAKKAPSDRQLSGKEVQK